MSISYMRAWLVIVVLGCSAPARAPSVATREAPTSTCGNGIVDEGEACDPNVRWERTCPEGWGMCWSCSAACGLVPTFSEEVESIPQEVFCTQKTYGPLLTRTYDERGNVLTQFDDETPWRYTFTRDETGAMTELDIKYRYNNTDHHSHQRFTLDEKHRKVRSVDDNDPTRVWHHDYTPDGKRQRVWGGTAVEGVPEADYRFAYDGEGRLVAQVTTFRDAPWHSATTFAYDHLGREVAYSSGITKDTSVPSVDCRTTYDTSGSRRCCTVASPSTKVCTTRDVRGEVTMMTNEQGGAPMTFTRHENEYDKRGLLLRSSVKDHDGGLNRIERSRYDERGLLLGRTQQQPGGATTVTIERTYDCLEQVFATMPRRRFVERR